MVPLERFDYEERGLTVEEFTYWFLMQVCAYMYLLPPNQMIFVKLKKPEKVRFMVPTNSY